MQGYQLIDAGQGQRLEQWGPYCIIRPDSTAQWPAQPIPQWQHADAQYRVTSGQNGSWEMYKPFPEKWSISLEEWVFSVGFGSSKHLGLFPEQLEQWKVLRDLITTNAHQFSATKPLSFLNLFAYTGAASIAATSAGAFTTHVDSSAPAIGRAKENQALNNLDPHSIRWIKDDVMTFVQREVRREKKYDIIALDPPAFGHGSHGEQFSIRKTLPLLLTEVRKLLSDKALAVFITTYTADWGPTELKTLCSSIFPDSELKISPLTLQAETGIELTTGNWAYLHIR